MTIEELIEHVNVIFNDGAVAQVYLILRKDNEFEIKKADIEDIAEAEIRNMFCNEINSKIISNEDLQIRNLSTTDESSNCIYLYDYDSYPEELSIFKNFDIKVAVDYDKFNFKDDDLSNLFGFIIYIGTMYEGITLFKKHYPISLIKRDSFLLGIGKDSERFKKISGNDIIRLNSDIHLLRSNDQIYVLNIKMLEQNMGFTCLIQKSAEESIKAIDNLDIVEDMQAIKDSMDDISFVRKLSKVKKASPIFTLGIDSGTIINFIKNTKELSGKFKYNESGNKIRLDTKNAKKAFLSLMNDSFLKSELTKLYYEANSKDNLKESV